MTSTAFTGLCGSVLSVTRTGANRQGLCSTPSRARGRGSAARWQGCAAAAETAQAAGGEDPGATGSVAAKGGMLTQREFDRNRENGELTIAFIGMSNCGKSFRAQQLCFDKGFIKYCIDDEIEFSISKTEGVKPGIEGLANWLGMPFDEGFAEREKKYLGLEETRTRLCIGGRHHANVALDTTGSVVYLSDALQVALRESFLVVHFEADESMLDEMCNSFFDLPKPVSWGGLFNQMDGEENDAAMRRCYPKLLESRSQLYQELAHVTVSAGLTRNFEVSVDEFLDTVRSKLPE